jgi:hypothetical protein
VEFRRSNLINIGYVGAEDRKYKGGVEREDREGIIEEKTTWRQTT